MGRVLRANYSQDFLLPPALSEWVPPEHPARFVRDFVDELDLKALGIREPKGEEGRPPYAADLLLKVWLFGWMDRVRSTRQLEKACLQVMPFLWLTGNLHPDHNTIWRFFNDNRKVLPKLFKQIVQIANEAGLIGFALHALDGTKMAAASSMDTARHRKSLEEMLKDVDQIIEAYVQEVEAKRSAEQQTEGYVMPEPMLDPSARREKIRALLARRLEDRQDAGSATKAAAPAQQFDLPVDGNPAGKAPQVDARPGPQHAPEMRATASDEAKATQVEVEAVPQPETSATASDEAKATQVEVKPAPKTEVEALKAEAEALKRELLAQRAQLDVAKTDHLHPKETDARMMKGRGMYALGYNAQAVVDHDSDLIVACDVVTQQNDQGQLVPMLKQVHETLGKVAAQSLADSGYCSGEEFAKAEQEKTPVLVSIPQEAATKGAFSKSHFRFEAELDVYVCPQGEQLVQVGTSKPRAGATHDDTIYRCHNASCPVRAACTTSPRGRQIRRTPFEDALERQERKQEDPRMRILLSLRKEIIEHLFGIVKTIDGFRRFTVRSLEKAQAQWALVCSAVNLRKLYAFWRQGTLKLGSLTTPASGSEAAALA
jgi:transposase